MNVLVCIPCLLTGGTEIQTLSLVEALVAADHRPIVTCYFEYATTMVERYRAAGAVVELMSTDSNRPVGIPRTVAHLWKGLRRILRKYKPDVAHVQYMAPGALPILVLWALGLKKIIATAHTSADIYPSLRQIHWLNRHILTAFQCITLRAETSFFGSGSLLSESTILKKHDNHFTIYNNLPSYIEPTETPRAEIPRTIGVVSRLEKIKGMDLVIPAFAQIHAQHPEMRLLIVGDGSLREMMGRQVKEFQLPADSIEFAGRQPQDSLQDYYDRIDILLMPSRSEGFGLTAIEGMARGCVPVVANTGGLPEVVENGVSGVLHKPECITDLANQILYLLSSDLSTYSLSALNRAKLFASCNYTEQIKLLYHKIIFS